MRALLVCLVCGALASLNASPAHATTIVGGDIASLASDADAVVAGTVVSTEAVAVDGRIETRTVLRIEQVYQGVVAGDALEIVSPGGRVGDLAMRVAGADAYAVGEQVLVFLSRRDDGAWSSTALAFSKFSLRWDGQQWLAVRDADGASIVVQDESGAWTSPTTPFPSELQLDELEGPLLNPGPVAP